MLILLLGPDDFSKDQYLEDLRLKNKAEVEVFGVGDELPRAEYFCEQNLFAQARIFVLRSVLSKFGLKDAELEKLIATPNHIVVVEEKLDKRTVETKKLLANKKIKVQEFALPHGRELDVWIVERVRQLGGSIQPEAVDELAKSRDQAKETKFGGKVVAVEEIFNLWQADSEVQKLFSSSVDHVITKELVEQLVSQSGEVDVFDIINAAGEKDKNRTLQLIGGFLEVETGTDEKSGIIQLNALLAEQFRNVLIVQSFGEQGAPDGEILSQTGWKSGRLFIMKRIASKFSAKKVLDFLHKLAALDEELKTSSTPPRVLLDLIVSQLVI